MKYQTYCLRMWFFMKCTSWVPFQIYSYVGLCMHFNVYVQFYHMTQSLFNHFPMVGQAFTAFCHYRQCCDECPCTHLYPHLIIICLGQIIGDKLLIWRESNLFKYVSLKQVKYKATDHSLYPATPLFWVWKVLCVFVTSCRRNIFPVPKLFHIQFLCPFSSLWNHWPLSLLSSALQVFIIVPATLSFVQMIQSTVNMHEAFTLC